MKRGNSEISDAGTSIPDCNIYCKIPTVLRHTDFPPAFGPEIRRILFSPLNSILRGTISLPSLERAFSKIGCLPLTILICLSSVKMGFPALIEIATLDLALIKSIFERNSAEIIKSGA